MKNRRTWLLVVGAIALLAAVGGGLYAYRFYDSLVTTAKVVTVVAPLPPYTLITPALVQERSVPRPILEEPIYRTPGELVGRVTSMALVPGQIIYRHQAVQQVHLRYTDDPSLEVVSFPIDPSKAVGGQVKIGHRINVYRVQEMDSDPSTLLSRPWNETVVVTDPSRARGAVAEVLAEGVPVVDIRARQGEPAGLPAAPSEMERTAQTSQVKPLQILTVAVAPETARKLVELAVDDQTTFEIWVTLAPLQTEDARAVAEE
jgi:Flp pilus assembly protein CpaB